MKQWHPGARGVLHAEPRKMWASRQMGTTWNYQMNLEPKLEVSHSILTGFSWIFHDKPSISWYPPFQDTPFARETILANGFTIGRLQQEPVVPLQLLQPPDHEHSRSNAAVGPLSKAVFQEIFVLIHHLAALNI